MSVLSLPLQPSVRHLKNEAKQLHKALQAGESAAADRARAGLPRLSAGDDTNSVTLMEAQHVLAREYGFREWPALAAAAELEFDGLADLSDEDTHRLLREVDQKDLVVGLKLASDAVRIRMLTGMSDRVRQFISEEMMFLGDLPQEQVLEVQGRILHQVRCLARDGAIGWPLGADTPAPKPRQDLELAPDLAAMLGRHLIELNLDAVRNLVRGLRALCQAHGVLSLEAAATAAADGFVREGLRLAVDGTEPDLLEDILLTRRRAVLQSFDNRCRMTIEGCVAIAAGDNPRIVMHKLQSVYSIDFDKELNPAQGNVADLRESLHAQPVHSMTLDQFTELFGGLAGIRRRQDRSALAEIVDDIDDEFLQAGLRQVADGAELGPIIEDLESRMPAVLETVAACYRLFTAGITAVSKGKTGLELEAVLDAA